MLKVEQRMKDSLSKIDYNSLQNVVSRYSFKDLSPCSSDDLNHLIRHELISKNINKSDIVNVIVLIDHKNRINSEFRKIVYPDISKMVSYPSQKITHVQQHVTRTLTQKLAAFAANMPLVPGNFSSLRIKSKRESIIKIMMKMTAQSKANLFKMLSDCANDSKLTVFLRTVDRNHTEVDFQGNSLVGLSDLYVYIVPCCKLL